MPGVVGHTVMVSGYPMTVVGVTPRGFDGLDPGQRVDLRRASRDAGRSARRRAVDAAAPQQPGICTIVARLKHGVSIEQAQQAIGAGSRST